MFLLRKHKTSAKVDSSQFHMSRWMVDSGGSSCGAVPLWGCRGAPPTAPRLQPRLVSHGWLGWPATERDSAGVNQSFTRRHTANSVASEVAANRQTQPVEFLTDGLAASWCFRHRQRGAKCTNLFPTTMRWAACPWTCYLCVLCVVMAEAAAQIRQTTCADDVTISQQCSWVADPCPWQGFYLVRFLLFVFLKR